MAFQEEVIEEQWIWITPSKASARNMPQGDICKFNKSLTKVYWRWHIDKATWKAQGYRQKKINDKPF